MTDGLYPPSMDDNKEPFDRVLDVLVYAPLGFALEFRRVVPELAESGRRQARFAQSLGKMAFDAMGRSQANKRASAAGSANAASASRSAEETTEAAPAAKKPAKAAPEQVDEILPTYDTLTARNIVGRLSDLTPKQRSIVASYEAANRGRVTVLNRIEALS